MEELDDGGKCVFESPHFCLNMNKLIKKTNIYVMIATWKEGMLIYVHGYNWLVLGGGYVCMCRRRRRRRRSVGFQGIPTWLLGDSLNNKSQCSNMSAAMLFFFFFFNVKFLSIFYNIFINYTKNFISSCLSSPLYFSY